MIEVTLTKGLVSLIDDGDAGLVLPLKWCASMDGHRAYAYTNRNGTNLAMHRLLLSPPSGMVVDHINGNGLDNRRANIRIATVAENCRNSRKLSGCSSEFKGVSKLPGRRKWTASIQPNGRTILLGNYATEEIAAIAYDIAALFFFKDFAALNFPLRKHEDEFVALILTRIRVADILDDAEPALRTHCIRGHEYKEGSFRTKANGSRVCKACCQIREARRVRSR